MKNKRQITRQLRQNNRRSALTLLELITVLAIIAGLFLLLIPNVRSHRARARSAQCQNNLRQYGIAMAQYMADWNGYFIQPGSGGSSLGSIVAAYGFDAQDYYSLRSSGSQKGSHSQNWLDHFVPAYLPTPEITATSLRAGLNSVRLCPETPREVFLPSSPEHKGYREELDETLGELILSDFEKRYAGSDSDEEILYDESEDIVFAPYFTTYGINNARTGSNGRSGAYAVYQKTASNVPNRVVAFIDWNASDGWLANIAPSDAVWQFSKTEKGGTIIHSQGSPKTIKDWWHSEVGFNHPGRSNNPVANYVAMDGSVHSVSSNEISIDYFR